MKVNAGSCDSLLDRPWINVDRHDFSRPGYDFRQMDLNRPWPFEESSVSELRAHDIFEHLWPTVMQASQGPGTGTPTLVSYDGGLTWTADSREQRRIDIPPKIWVMNEAHRVLRPGGVLSLIVPTTDGRGAFQDPTHVSWWTPNDMFYFADHWLEWSRFRQAYGITARFRVEGCEQDEREAAWAKVNEGHTNSGQGVMKLAVRLVAIK